MNNTNNFTSYKNRFKFVIFLLIAVAFLIFFASAIVFPLWFFSQKSPSMYSIVACCIIGIIALFFLAKTIVKNFYNKSFRLKLLKILLFLFFIALSIYTLFNYSRILALIFLLVPFLFAFFIPTNITRESWKSFLRFYFYFYLQWLLLFRGYPTLKLKI